MRGIINSSNVSEADIIEALRSEGIDEQTTITILAQVREDAREMRYGRPERTYLDMVFSQEGAR